MADRFTGRAEMRTPAILSAAVHVFALIAVIVNFDLFNRPPIEPEPVMVDFVAVAKHAAAPKVGITEEQPKEAKLSDETSKAPPPPSKEPPPAPETPKPETKETVPVPPKPDEKPKAEQPKPTEDKIALKPKEPEPPKVDKPPEPKPDPKPEVKKIEKPVTPPPKPQQKKDSVDNIVDSILKNQDKNPPIKTPQQSPQRPKEITRAPSMARNLADVVTASEIEAVREKIRPCWNSLAGAKEAPVISFEVQMNQDGTPANVEIKELGRYNSDPVYRAAAESAWRALMNPRCQPWPLPSDRFDGWRSITFNFDPRDY